MNSKKKKRKGISAVDIRGYDKKIYLLSFFLIGFALIIPAFFVENTTILSIFTIIVALSFGREINTVIEDVKPTKKNFWIIFLIALVVALSILVLGLWLGWDKLWTATKWSVKNIPPYPPKFMLAFLSLAAILLIKPIIISSFTHHFRITRNEIETIRCVVPMEDMTIDGALIRSRVVITDLRELLSFLLAGTIVIEKQDGKEWIELLKVDDVIFAHLKSWKINKAFNAKTVIVTTAESIE